MQFVTVIDPPRLPITSKLVCGTMRPMQHSGVRLPHCGMNGAGGAVGPSTSPRLGQEPPAGVAGLLGGLGD